MALGLGLTLVVAHQLHPRPVGQLVVVTAELVEIELARAIHVGRSELLLEVGRRFRAPLPYYRAWTASTLRSMTYWS